ncbi:MAG: hypothetical protein Ct9H300mP1_36200 [Planctomycetaceae bacterium]|nr:MAG: hypothetical protein Ct9H300mP1_36200 [Planctomycetaceae bacterium]
MSRFDDLLSGSGDRRYRLRAHIAVLDADRKASFDCGIRTGVVPISISDSGFWFAHVFSNSVEKTDLLRTYWHQDGKKLPGPGGTTSRCQRRPEETSGTRSISTPGTLKCMRGLMDTMNGNPHWSESMNTK